jgi:PAS domain S-box-containing protein
MQPPKPPNEQARLSALREYNILDTLPEPAFDDFTELASYICQTPIATITMIDAERQWHKSRIGLESQEASRDVALCAFTILEPDRLMIVEDTLVDVRFATNPLVTADPSIRFYAGAPLVTPDGHALGTICAIDRRPRRLDEEQQSALRMLARLIMNQLELRKQQLEQTTLLKTAIESATEGVFITDVLQPTRPIVYANPAMERITGYANEELEERGLGTLYRSVVDPKARARIRAALNADQPSQATLQYSPRGSAPRWVELALSPVRDENGRLTHYVGLASDITDRKLGEEALRQSEQSLQRANAELVLSYNDTLEGWSRAMDLRDKETEGHTQRVTEMTMQLARAMGVSEEAIVHIRRGALLHDMGKMGIPDNILLKPDKLTEGEWAIMRRHPGYAYDLLSPIEYLRPAMDIPYYHHEKWDGTGYPAGLAGEQIPLAARLFAVVDIWDALRSDRPYRPAWPEEAVLAHIASLAGTHLDPKVVEAFLRLFPGT